MAVDRLPRRAGPCGGRPRRTASGCGLRCRDGGGAVSLAGGAGRGSRVGGIDATGALLSIARERTPGGDFRQGELEALPFADAGFDLVTGFNAFQFAGEPAQAQQAGAPVLARPRILSPHCRTDPWTIGAARQLWIFAVRSLIWNPRFDVAERRAATAVVARRSNQEDPSMTLPAFFDAMPPDPLNL